MEPYIIATPRLGLRKWKPTDFLPFVRMNSNQKVMQYFPKTLTAKETQQMIQRVHQHFEQHGFGLYALEKLSNREFIGYTGFLIPQFESFFTPCVEIGWRIKKEEWNKGYATEAARGCLEYGFTVLQLRELYSFTSLLNRASERVMQKIGMFKVGEFHHPHLSTDHPLCRHVVYKIDKQAFNSSDMK